MLLNYTWLKLLDNSNILNLAPFSTDVKHDVHFDRWGYAANTVLSRSPCTEALGEMSLLCVTPGNSCNDHHGRSVLGLQPGTIYNT